MLDKYKCGLCKEEMVKICDKLIGGANYEIWKCEKCHREVVKRLN